MLRYRLAWYNKGRVVAIRPLDHPDITYLVDIEDNNGNMSCSCDTFMYHGDPQLPGYLAKPFQPCRHILLTALVLKRGLLQT